MQNNTKARICEARPFMHPLQLSNFSTDFDKPFYDMQNVNKLESYQTYFYAILNANKLETNQTTSHAMRH
jgi:hypothetical protein